MCAAKGEIQWNRLRSRVLLLRAFFHQSPTHLFSRHTRRKIEHARKKRLDSRPSRSVLREMRS